jgi:hypothetical protein
MEEFKIVLLQFDPGLFHFRVAMEESRAGVVRFDPKWERFRVGFSRRRAGSEQGGPALGASWQGHQGFRAPNMPDREPSRARSVPGGQLLRAGDGSRSGGGVEMRRLVRAVAKVTQTSGLRLAATKAVP